MLNLDCVVAGQAVRRFDGAPWTVRTSRGILKRTASNLGGVVSYEGTTKATIQGLDDADCGVSGTVELVNFAFAFTDEHFRHRGEVILRKLSLIHVDQIDWK